LAGTAFLPWEKWLAWLVHKVAMAIRRLPTEDSDSGI